MSITTFKSLSNLKRTSVTTSGIKFKTMSSRPKRPTDRLSMAINWTKIFQSVDTIDAVECRNLSHTAVVLTHRTNWITLQTILTAPTWTQLVKELLGPTARIITDHKCSINRLSTATSAPKMCNVGTLMILPWLPIRPNTIRRTIAVIGRLCSLHCVLIGNATIPREYSAPSQKRTNALTAVGAITRCRLSTLSVQLKSLAAVTRARKD